MAFKGSCLCGLIEYEVKSFEQGFMFCHCQRCRKASGSAFASNAPVLTKNFTLIKGKEALKLYKTIAGVMRSFCRECGSPLYSQRDYAPELLRIRMGTLDTPLNAHIKPCGHIYVGSKADWDHINDELPQFMEAPPASSK